MICRYFKEGKKLDVAGLNEITVLIDRSETELSEVALNSWWPGLDGPPHKHEQKEQIFFVISGQGSVKIGDEVFPAKPGDLFYVPANVIHQTINQGKAPLDYLLFNAFLDSDKEGHASFAEHVEHMKATRKLQAQTQRADAGSSQPLVSSKAKGKCLRGASALKLNASSPVSQVLLLDRAETQRCEAALVSWSAGKGTALETDGAREQTLFVLAGTGSLTVGGETKPVKHGDVVFVSRGARCAAQAGPEGLTCLSLNTILSRGKSKSGQTPGPIPASW
jgi:mannose-6-phosphate isomerase-like protein (cupin superfamily)